MYRRIGDSYFFCSLDTDLVSNEHVRREFDALSCTISSKIQASNTVSRVVCPLPYIKAVNPNSVERRRVWKQSTCDFRVLCQVLETCVLCHRSMYPGSAGVACLQYFHYTTSVMPGERVADIPYTSSMPKDQFLLNIELDKMTFMPRVCCIQCVLSQRIRPDLNVLYEKCCHRISDSDKIEKILVQDENFCTSILTPSLFVLLKNINAKAYDLVHENDMIEHYTRRISESCVYCNTRADPYESSMNNNIPAVQCVKNRLVVDQFIEYLRSKHRYDIVSLEDEKQDLLFQAEHRDNGKLNNNIDEGSHGGRNLTELDGECYIKYRFLENVQQTILEEVYKLRTNDVFIHKLFNGHFYRTDERIFFVTNQKQCSTYCMLSYRSFVFDVLEKFAQYRWNSCMVQTPSIASMLTPSPNYQRKKKCTDLCDSAVISTQTESNLPNQQGYQKKDDILMRPMTPPTFVNENDFSLHETEFKRKSTRSILEYPTLSNAKYVFLACILHTMETKVGNIMHDIILTNNRRRAKCRGCHCSLVSPLSSVESVTCSGEYNHIVNKNLPYTDQMFVYCSYECYKKNQKRMALLYTTMNSSFFCLKHTTDFTHAHEHSMFGSSSTISSTATMRQKLLYSHGA